MQRLTKSHSTIFQLNNGLWHEQYPRAWHVYVKFSLQTMFVHFLNVSLKRREAGETG